MNSMPSNSARPSVAGTSETSDRPLKRTKLFRACDGCVQSKTRCDDVTADGCLLCRRKHKTCSLAEAVQADNTQDEDTKEVLKAKLEVLEARAWDLELRMRQVEASQTPSGPPTNPPMATASSSHATPAGLVYGANNIHDLDLEVQMHEWKGYTWTFNERMFSVTKSSGYPDVIKMGLIPREQAEMAFQLFKHRFSLKLPLASFLIASTPLPSHPFVVTAILSHIPSMGSPALVNAVNESFTQALSGAVSIDVVLALLILALSPGATTAPSALRTLATAFETGTALGLESKTQAGIRSLDLLYQPLFVNRLDEILLWEAVKVQYNLAHLSLTGSHLIQPSSAHLLPLYPADNYREAIRHLQLANKIIDIFRPMVTFMAEAEAAQSYGIFDVAAASQAGKELGSRVDELHRTVPLSDQLQSDLLFAHFNCCYRLVRFVQILPIPLNAEEKLHALGLSGSKMVFTAKLVLDMFLNMDDCHLLPPHTVISIASATMCMRSVADHTARHRQRFSPFELDNCDEAEAKLKRVGGTSFHIMSRWYDQFLKMGRRYGGDPDDSDNGQPGDALAAPGGPVLATSVEQFLFDLGDPMSFLNHSDLDTWNWQFQHPQNQQTPMYPPPHSGMMKDHHVLGHHNMI